MIEPPQNTDAERRLKWKQSTINTDDPGFTSAKGASFPDMPLWPEPRDGDEDDDPLFDSQRGYVEQMDRYKEHQDKPTGHKRTDKTCEVCGTDYTTRRSNSRYCSKKCRLQSRYL